MPPPRRPRLPPLAAVARAAEALALKTHPFLGRVTNPRFTTGFKYATIGLNTDPEKAGMRYAQPHLM